MGFRFSRRWCSTGVGPRGRCPPSWAGTRFFFLGLRPAGFMRGRLSLHPLCRRSALRPGKLCGAGSPCAHRCEEGLRPSRSKSLDLALRSSPWVGLPGPHPGFLSFHDERNQRRAGAAPLDPRWGALSSPQQRGALLPPERVCATDPGRFATLSLWANRSFFLPRFLRGHTFWFQAVARQVGELMVRVASALGREQGLPIFLSLIQGKTAGYPVGSAGRT